MSEQWGRTNDALIARVAEGLEVKELSFWDRSEFGTLNDKQVYDLIPAYNLDLAACVRAAEAWRKQAKHNQWIIESPITDDATESQFVAIVWGTFGEDGREAADTPAEALARALHAACEGRESE